MIKYIVESGMIDSKGNYISYECDQSFDTIEDANLYVDNHICMITHSQYYTIWCYDCENKVYKFIERYEVYKFTERDLGGNVDEKISIKS